MPITIKVNQVLARLHWVETRMPFRYGSASLTRCPHLYLSVEIEDGQGRRAQGIAADNLPPRWFDKTPEKPYEQELREQLLVIGWAADAAAAHPPATAFDLWWDVYHDVLSRARALQLPDLLAGFGPSLVERAVLEAVGRLAHLPFAAMVPSGILGIDLGRFAALRGDESLARVPTTALVASRPLRRVYARHTVGMADPIRETDIDPAERLTDRLPQSLEACIHSYGYRYFKIKLANRLEADLDRLVEIAALLDQEFPSAPYHVSLDGNEQYTAIEELEGLLHAMRRDPRLARFAPAILFIEQPLARQVALDPAHCAGLQALSRRLPITIDESDADLSAFCEAVALGYAGTSHKNCKNVFKSLANAARVHLGESRGLSLFLTAEDLTNLAPVALLEDLAVVAALGISHVERNGHHYFRGLSHLSPDEQERLRSQHPPLFKRTGDLVHLDIRQGQIDCQSLQLPGLGVGLWPDQEGWIDLAAFDPGGAQPSP